MRYCLYDPDKTKRGVKAIPEKETRDWNEKKWGIFHTVQKFKDEVRQIKNLDRIRAWAIDMDDLNKLEQKKLINQAPLKPSRVIESKNGYHVYWFAKDASIDRFDDIMKRLITFFKADPRAKDLARILRSPGYKHWKDPSDPYLVQVVYDYNVSYKEKHMLSFFPEVHTHEHTGFIYKQKESNDSLSVTQSKKWSNGDSFWDKINKLNCEQALAQLSGHPSVNHEKFTFQQTTRGRKNILVNGKMTSCFIDQNGKIGSLDNGGPTPIQWLMWYGLTKKDAVEVVKNVFNF